MPKLIAGALLLVPFFFNTVNSQSVSINNTGTAPNASAMLDVQSSSKGILLPQVNLTGISDVTTVPSPATSLLVYNTNASITGGSGAGFYYWSGTQWVKLITVVTTAWNLTGNAGTSPGVHFIGTTDNIPLLFKVNNQKAGYLDTAGNAFWGYQSGNNNTSYSNVGIGIKALYNNTSKSNLVAVGDSALFNNTSGIENTAVGSKSLFSNTSGFDNTASGSNALYSNLSGRWNTANGAYALYSNSIGQQNTADGYNTLYSDTSGSFNTATGYQALALNTTGNYNVAYGEQALFYNTIGYGNTATGLDALFNNTLGFNNTAGGYHALFSNVIGSGITALGYNADVSSNNLNNATAIGAESVVSCSDCMVLGKPNVHVGIGTSSPISTLHVKGSVKVFDGGVSTHTGNFFDGSSNVNGIEIGTSLAGDAFISIQRGAGGYCLHLSKPTGGTALAGFYVAGSTVGQITTNGTTTSYGSTSDIRLRENIISTHYGLSTLLKLDVKDYTFKADALKELQTGFSAQDLYKIFPQAVQVGGADPKTNPWTVDYSKLTPLLVKAVQELQQIIEQQQSDIREMKEQIAEIKKSVK